LCGGCGCGSGWDDKGELVGDVSLSFVDAIWVSNDARRRRSSAEGYEWISNGAACGDTVLGVAAATAGGGGEACGGEAPPERVGEREWD
jgi:hypothetical protein